MSKPTLNEFLTGVCAEPNAVSVADVLALAKMVKRQRALIGHFVMASRDDHMSGECGACIAVVNTLIPEEKP